MEPANQPFRKENDLKQTSMIMFHVNLQGCTCNKNTQPVGSTLVSKGVFIRHACPLGRGSTTRFTKVTKTNPLQVMG